jgi:tRNA-2-methylthio-N6-dimethylallyladenosine synthase
MKKKNLAIITYGCQMNEYDSERIVGVLQAQDGYNLVDDIAQAHIILLNTCSIREKAEQKVFSKLGRLKQLKHKHPELIIGVGGCVAQREGYRIIERAPQVDMVFGTRNIKLLPQFLAEVVNTKNKIANTDPYPEDINPTHIERMSKVKAWVSIMQGCNNFCTYCVVPYSRGPQQSLSSRQIEQEAKGLAQRGFKEIILLGQNVNSYGQDLNGEIDFPDLLALLNKIQGIERIRFVTSHPKDFSEKLIRAMAELPKVCESIHLPIQSGSQYILERMNRKYRVGDYVNKVKQLRDGIPEIGITSDIIVGFPGEKEEDFLQTEELIRLIEYDSIFLFKYSARPETPAASFPEHIKENIKQERFNRILSLQKAITLRKNKSLEGSLVEILVEGRSKKNPERLTGRTRNNKIVNLDGNNNFINKKVQVKIVSAKLYSLEGQLLNY